jgi:hypothetical protein
VFDTVTFWNGVELSLSDLPRGELGWVMWRLLTLAATQCLDRESALEALRDEAEEILKLATGAPSDYHSPEARDGMN